MGTPGGSYAEFAVAWDYTTFHIPKNISFEGGYCVQCYLLLFLQLHPLIDDAGWLFLPPKVGLTYRLLYPEAATLPLAFMTSAIGLYYHLRLPSPWTPTDIRTPLVIYGGASAVGALAIKLAKLSNIHPIIAVAGGGAPFVETLIDRSKGDTIVDYRQSDDAVTAGIRDAVARAGCDRAEYAFDATTASNSWANIAGALSPTGHITFVMYDWQGKGLPNTLKLTQTYVGVVHGSISHDSKEAKAGLVVGGKEFGYVWFRLLGMGLKEGWMSPHPHEVIEGGLDSVGEALSRLKAGKASAIKYVLRVSESDQP